MDTSRPPCTLYVVRHGQTVWNVERKLQGQQNSDLTDVGISQARELREELSHIHFDAVFSSDASRAKQTAEIITLNKQLAVETSHLLRERNFGAYEGKTYDEWATGLKDLIDQFQTLTDEQKKTFQYAPDIESDDQIASRFLTFVREIAVAYAGKTILVVSHGAIMRASLIHLGVGNYEQLQGGAIGNGGYFVLESDGVEFRVKELKNITLSQTTQS